MASNQLNCALDLMRRLPPSNIEKDLECLIDLVPDLTEDLLSAVDQPLKVAHDPVSGKEYLLCDYNRDGDSYRSPWSNQYDPPLEDGAVPSDQLREMEVQANDMFDGYRQLYYCGGVSSVYFWDLDVGFAACILIKNDGSQSKGGLVAGSWNSIHVIEVKEKDAGNAVYKLTTTIMLTMDTDQEVVGKAEVSGTLTRQTETTCAVTKDTPHIVNIGKAVEDMELKLRNSLDQVYFGKGKEVMDAMRQVVRFGNEKALADELMASLKKGGLPGLKKT